MLNDALRVEIVNSIEDLAALDARNEKVWQRSYDLVCPNENQDDLVKFARAALIHYFVLAGEARDLGPDRQQLRELAAAIRSRVSVADFRKRYE